MAASVWSTHTQWDGIPAQFSFVAMENFHENPKKPFSIVHISAKILFLMSLEKLSLYNQLKPHFMGSYISTLKLVPKTIKNSKA